MPVATALLVFHRSPGREAELKALTGQSNSQRNYRALTALTRHTHQVAKASGLPVHYILDHEQVGDNFAERFTHAFQQLFRQGYKKVVAIGNDHPGLTENHILEAAEGLQHHDQVLGPATDGGFYLMGVWREAFNQLAFQQFPWQTRALKATYQHALQQAGQKAAYLAPLQDLDSAADLKALWPYPNRHSRQRSLIQWLKSLAQPFYAGSHVYQASTPLETRVRQDNARGPPFSFSV